MAANARNQKSEGHHHKYFGSKDEEKGVSFDSRKQAMS
jgi:hypothetical protein